MIRMFLSYLGEKKNQKLFIYITFNMYQMFQNSAEIVLKRRQFSHFQAQIFKNVAFSQILIL